MTTGTIWRRPPGALTLRSTDDLPATFGALCGPACFEARVLARRPSKIPVVVGEDLFPLLFGHVAFNGGHEGSNLVHHLDFGPRLTFALYPIEFSCGSDDIARFGNRRPRGDEVQPNLKHRP